MKRNYFASLAVTAILSVTPVSADRISDQAFRESQETRALYDHIHMCIQKQNHDECMLELLIKRLYSHAQGVDGELHIRRADSTNILNTGINMVRPSDVLQGDYSSLEEFQSWLFDYMLSDTREAGIRRRDHPDLAKKVREIKDSGVKDMGYIVHADRALVVIRFLEGIQKHADKSSKHRSFGMRSLRFLGYALPQYFVTY